MLLRSLWGCMVLMNAAGEGGAGGGGGAGAGAGGQGGGQGGAGGGQGGAAADTVTLTKAQYDEIMARLPAKQQAAGAGAGQGAGGQGGEGADDLAEKARKEREAKDKKNSDSKTLTTAIKFNMGGREWAKNNASLLPKSIEGIFEAAEKENYGTEVDKANAIKVGIVSEFFAVQTNVDLLTEAQKSKLAEFKALTKNDKHERVQDIYDVLFEPTFESLRSVTKARQLNLGHGTQTDAEAAYKEKLIKGARKHYLGEKTDA